MNLKSDMHSIVIYVCCISVLVMGVTIYALMQGNMERDKKIEQAQQEIANFKGTISDTSVYWIGVIKNNIKKYNNNYTEEQLQRIATYWYETCVQYNEDVLLTCAVAKIESQTFYYDVKKKKFMGVFFDEKAVSIKACIGLFQLKPGTAKYIADKEGIPYSATTELNMFKINSIEKSTKKTYNEKRQEIQNLVFDYVEKNPFSIESKLLNYKHNIRLGIAYLSYLRKKGLTDPERIKSYNIGIGNFINGKYLASGQTYYDLVWTEYQGLRLAHL